MPSKRVAIALAGTMSPRHFGWPVWFENATVLSDQVSQPRSCSGNSAAVLPTLPQATQDWIESTVGMSALSPCFDAVEHVLQIEKDDHAADDEQRQPGGMHRAALPGVRDEQAGKTDDGKKRHDDREVPHILDEQKIRQSGAVAVEATLQPQEGKCNRAEAEDHPAGVIAWPLGAAGGKGADHGERRQNEDLHPEPEP